MTLTDEMKARGWRPISEIAKLQVVLKKAPPIKAGLINLWIRF